MKRILSTVLLLTAGLSAKGQIFAPSDSCRSPDTLCIAAVGDLMLGTNYPNTGFLPPNDGKYLLQPVLPWLRSADITFGNLEGTVFDGQGHVKSCQDPTKCYAFRSPARYMNHLRDAGFDLLSVANNHMGDFGEVGRRATLASIDSAGLHAAGLLLRPFAVTEVKGRKIGLVAFAPNSGCLNLNDERNAVDLVKRYKQECDILIVSFHGGAEGSSHRHVTGQKEIFLGENRGNVYEFSHAVIDAGADLVLGHGPHVTRGCELYKGRFIAYSMGNFCTYGRFNLKGPNGMAPLFRIHIQPDGRFTEAWIVPVKQHGEGGPVLDPEGAVIRDIIQLNREDFVNSGLHIAPNGKITPNP